MSFFEWLDGFFGGFGGKQQASSGWQRERAEQETDGYQLPDLLKGIAGGERWGGPVGSLLAAHRTQIHTPIEPLSRDTGEMTAMKQALRGNVQQRVHREINKREK